MSGHVERRVIWSEVNIELRRRVVFVLAVISLGPLLWGSLPARAQGAVAVEALKRAGKWVLGQLASYATSKIIDRALGVDPERQIEGVRSDLQREIDALRAQVPETSDQMRMRQLRLDQARESLDLATMELNAMRGLKSGRLSSDDARRMRFELNARLAEFDQRLRETEKELALLQRRVGTLEGNVASHEARIQALESRQSGAPRPTPRVVPSPMSAAVAPPSISFTSRVNTTVSVRIVGMPPARVPASDTGPAVSFLNGTDEAVWLLLSCRAEDRVSGEALAPKTKARFRCGDTVGLYVHSTAGKPRFFPNAEYVVGAEGSVLALKSPAP